ncbi:elongin A, like isoform X1 [Oncorhynchus tshawytscha]|uniref:elongin A, like isoform X1 n=1 Tax=Oncorhynchus tshawytscha TaxID=74940 RepID=UPI000D0A08B4|nr:elongin A, like isoform X1 [Oncorhynchus tshawytscha]
MDALDVSKKVLQLKLQLKETTESKKVLKILKKLRELDITLDILAETGIGKAVNSLRKHGDAGEAVRLLVSHWKKLVPKETLSHTEKDASQSKLLVTAAEIQNRSKEACSKIEDRSQNTSEDERLKTVEDNQDGPTSRGVHLKTDEKNKGTSEKEHLKTDRNEESLETEYKNQGTSKDEHLKTEDKNQGTAEMSHLQEVDEDSSELKNDNFKSEKENKRTWKKDKDEGKKQKGTRECLMVTGKKSNWSRNSEDENVVLPNTTFSSKSSHKKAKSISREESNNSDNGGKCGIRRDSNRKTLPCPKPSSDESSKSKPDRKWTVIDKSNDQDNKKVSDSLGCNGERRKPSERNQVCHEDKKTKQEGKSKTKEKMAIEDKPNGDDVEVPSMSFESFLSYDINTPKRKKKSDSKKTPKKLKTVEKEVKVVKTPSTKTNKQLPAATADFSLPKKAMNGSVMDLLNIPLPTFLPEYDELSNFNYYDRKMEEKSKVLVSEGPVFTGQRLNRKMQVYSGAKSAFLPTMMSLYQQCIRALQNNIDLLYEIGGVPFEILEPVLERCTPDQLFRIEECNPMYVGLTDHLWEKHCQRDFRNAHLEEYESWREMHMRLSEERERKLQRLTKTIVSAHSGKPKGRQVKMAFINSVAKPPRNVRIQQEIHGTARHPRIQQENNGPTGVVLPPHPLDRPSVKAQENRARPCYVEPPRPSTTVSGTSQGQDSRKKTPVVGQQLLVEVHACALMQDYILTSR